MKRSTRRLLIIGLIVSTLLLGAGSIYIGLNVSNNDTSPDIVQAAGQCGSTCTTDSDCTDTAKDTSGNPVGKCTGGVCVNKYCKGTTRAGKNCECDYDNVCGDQCGIALGGCADGSTCGFINIDQASCSTVENQSGDSNNYQYCIPREPVAGYDTQICSDISARQLVNSSGTSIGLTQKDIKIACGLALACGNGTVESGEACDNGTLNGTAGNACTSTCTLQPQCNDGKDNDGDGKIDCKSGNQDPGCFTDGHGGGTCDSTNNSEIDIVAAASSVCGDGICSADETTTSCPSDCVQLPATAISSDTTFKLITGAGLIAFGTLLYVGAKKQRKIKLTIND